MHKVSKSAKETEKIAGEFLKKAFRENKDRKGALIVALSGNLGSGKTAFAKAAAKHLGIKSRVSSPTFVIMKRYPLKHQGYEFFFHIDAYRLKNEKEVRVLGWKEIIAGKNNLVFIEWPENVKGAIPRAALRVEISGEGTDKRNFKFS